MFLLEAMEGAVTQIQTSHFTFNLSTTNNHARGIWYSQYLQVGDTKKPCLSLTIHTSDAEALFGPTIIKTARLSKIEALYTCVLDDKHTFDKYSFGKELLSWVVQYIKGNFKHVEYLQLDDESYIPCNRESNETLDLLTYSIALYGKTWYELHFNAIISDKNLYNTYLSQVETYKSNATKSEILWDRFFLQYVTLPYAKDIITANEEYYKNMYDTSLNFPEFFRKVKDGIGENKCKFFKGWLQEFISSHININRRWTIPITQRGGSKTRKQRHSRKALRTNH